jgi:hypothetical protein
MWNQQRLAWMRTLAGWLAALLLVMLLAGMVAAGAWAAVVIVGIGAALLCSRRVRHTLTRIAHRSPVRLRRDARGRADWSGIGRILALMTSLDAPGRRGTRFPSMGGPQRRARRSGPRRSYYTGSDGTFYTSDARYDQDRARQRDWWAQDDYWNGRARDEDHYWADYRHDDWQRW